MVPTRWRYLDKIQIDILSLQVSNSQHGIHTHLCHLTFTATHSVDRIVWQLGSYCRFYAAASLYYMYAALNAQDLAMNCAKLSEKTEA